MVRHGELDLLAWGCVAGGVTLLLLGAYGQGVPPRSRLQEAHGRVVYLTSVKTGLEIDLAEENGQRRHLTYPHVNGKSGVVSRELWAVRHARVSVVFETLPDSVLAPRGAPQYEVYAIAADGREIRSTEQVANSLWWNAFALGAMGVLTLAFGAVRLWLQPRWETQR